jgi:hypothetical protein
MSKVSVTKAELNKELIEVDTQFHILMDRLFLDPSVRAEERPSLRKAVNDLFEQRRILRKRLRRKPRKTS